MIGFVTLMTVQKGGQVTKPVIVVSKLYILYVIQIRSSKDFW